MPGWAGFLRGDEGGHRTVGHDGIVSGFLSQLTIAPEDGIGVVVLGNTGALDGRGAPQPLGTALLRRLLSCPTPRCCTDLLPRPETWADVCGWYGPDPGTVTNLFIRAFMGAGAEVMVDGSLSGAGSGSFRSQRYAEVGACTPTLPTIQKCSG